MSSANPIDQLRKACITNLGANASLSDDGKTLTLFGSSHDAATPHTFTLNDGKGGTKEVTYTLASIYLQLLNPRLLQYRKACESANVENPVAVLDQEEAKKFLTGKAEDKYAFFTKATELERLDRCYASVFDNIVEQTEVGERARENIGGSIENTKKLKEEWDQFQELDKLEVKVQQLRASYGWSIHGEFNDDLEAAMKVRGFICICCIFFPCSNI